MDSCREPAGLCLLFDIFTHRLEEWKQGGWEMGKQQRAQTGAIEQIMGNWFEQHLSPLPPFFF